LQLRISKSALGSCAKQVLQISIRTNKYFMWFFGV
jgi:hypothetical protein